MANLEQLIENQLRTLPAEYGATRKGDKIWICCPFHKSAGRLERTPSCKINLTTSFDFATGSFYCFGCGAHGNWEKLAVEVGLKKLTKQLAYQDEASSGLSDVEKEELFGCEETINTRISLGWQPGQNFRGIKGTLIRDIGGTLTIHPKNPSHLQLYLPVFTLGKEQGGIYCELEKTYEKKTMYFNTPGTWVQNALFMYDYVERMKKRFVIVGEGPRDALNPVQYGVPAVSLLGSKRSWNDYKGDLLLSLPNIKLVVLAFDPDEAGQGASKLAYHYLKNKVDVIRLKLPEVEYKDGKKAKLDPGALTQKQVASLSKKLESKLGFKKIKKAAP